MHAQKEAFLLIIAPYKTIVPLLFKEIFFYFIFLVDFFR